MIGISAGFPYPTGQYYITTELFNDTVRRIKPQGLDLLKGVSYSAVSRRRELSLTSSSTGDFNPSESQTSPTPFDNETYQEARKGVVTKLLQKIKGEEWNLSTFIGELPETLEYFKTTLNTLVRTYRAVKRGDLREVRRMRKRRKTTRPPVKRDSLLQETAGKWLEWRYAITPLMLDFDAVLKMLYKSSAKPRLSRLATGDKLSYFETRVSGYLGSSPIQSIMDQRCTLRLGLYYQVDPDIQAFKKLGLLNPVATLWELVPLSFVVDWFIPIGQYLGSLDAMAGVSVWSSWESQSYFTQHFLSSASFSREDGYSVSSTKGYSSERAYVRTDVPSFSVPLPSFTLSLSSKRLLDGLALTKSILLKDR